MEEKINLPVQLSAPLSVQCLAYLGDAVFELQVRQMLLAKGSRPINTINREARKYVSAKAQAAMYHKLEEHLSEDEISLMKRGRNLHSNSKARNAATVEYRHATGLETLFGYLYAKGYHDRLKEIFKICTEIGEEYDKN